MADDPTESSDPPADDVVGSGPVDDMAAEGPSTAAADSKIKGRGKKAPDAAGDPEPTIVRKKVVSKRVTEKGSAQGVKATGSRPSSKADHSDDDDFSYSKRYTPPKATYAPGPSPWWVPALMFGLLIIGGLVIMANYMGVFGDAQNIRLVIGLAFILGGIITATQYR